MLLNKDASLRATNIFSNSVVNPYKKILIDRLYRYIYIAEFITKYIVKKPIDIINYIN